MIPRLAEPELRLVLIATSGPAGAPDPEILRAALRGGVTLLQARAKDASPARFLDWCRTLRAIAEASGVRLLVNDRPDLALAAGAAGAHVGPADLPPVAARSVLGDRILGVSVRDFERLRAAEEAGADYLGVGALRATGTKPDARVIGIDGIAAIAARTRIPVVAIGGVGPGDVAALAGAGVVGVAVSSGILAAPDPEAAARAYRSGFSD